MGASTRALTWRKYSFAPLCTQGCVSSLANADRLCAGCPAPKSRRGKGRWSRVMATVGIRSSQDPQHLSQVAAVERLHTHVIEYFSSKETLHWAARVLTRLYLQGMLPGMYVSLSILGTGDLKISITVRTTPGELTADLIVLLQQQYYGVRTTFSVGLCLHRAHTGFLRSRTVSQVEISTQSFNSKPAQSKVQPKWPFSDSVRCTRIPCPSHTALYTKVY